MGPRLILIAALIVTTASALGTALLPLLLHHSPVALLVLNSDARNLMLASPQIDWPIVIGLAVPRRALSMLATYGLGVLYGRRMLAWSARRLPRVARWFDRFEHVYLRVRGPLLLLWPMYITSALAGVTRASLCEYLPWMLAGQLVHGMVVFYLGDALSAWIDVFVRWMGAHLWEATAVCVTLVVLQRLVSFLRRRQAPQE